MINSTVLCQQVKIGCHQETSLWEGTTHELNFIVFHSLPILPGYILPIISLNSTTSKHSPDLGEHSEPARTENTEPLIHYLKVYDSSEAEVQTVEARNLQLL